MLVIEELRDNDDRKSEDKVNDVIAGENQDDEQDNNDGSVNQENKKTNIKLHPTIKIGESKGDE